MQRVLVSLELELVAIMVCDHGGGDESLFAGRVFGAAMRGRGGKWLGSSFGDARNLEHAKGP